MISMIHRLKQVKEIRVVVVVCLFCFFFQGQGKSENFASCVSTRFAKEFRCWQRGNAVSKHIYERID